MRQAIAAIVPAYNEQARVSTVLDVLVQSDLLDEIVVVDDGSTDGTLSAIKNYSSLPNVRIVTHPENLGKGAALASGLNATQAPIIILADADLVGFSTDHLKILVEPLFQDPSVAMTIGVFVGGRAPTNMSQRLASILNGQRAIRADFMRQIPDLPGARFGVEVLMTLWARKNGYAVVKVNLPGLSQVMKEEKVGIFRGVLERLKMYQEILAIWLVLRFKRLPS